MVRIKELYDLFVSLLAAAIFKHFRIDTFVVSASDARAELNAAVHRVVVPHEPADEPNHDDWRLRGTVSCIRSE